MLLSTDTDAQPYRQSIEQWGEHIIFTDEVNSTNTLAKQRARAGDSHGTVIWAKTQNRGYGRMNREWISPDGGLWFSIILRPKRNISGLALLFSLWTLQFIQSQTNIRGMIRWPNDIMMENKKMGGILLEGSLSANNSTSDYIVVGIGLNVNNRGTRLADGTETVSITDITNNETNLSYFLEDLLIHLQFNYETAQERGFVAFQDDLNEVCSYLNRDVEISLNQEKNTYRAIEIGPEGQLIVADRQGQKQEFLSCDRIRSIS